MDYVVKLVVGKFLGTNCCKHELDGDELRGGELLLGQIFQIFFLLPLMQQGLLFAV